LFCLTILLSDLYCCILLFHSSVSSSTHNLSLIYLKRSHSSFFTLFPSHHLPSRPMSGGRRASFLFFSDFLLVFVLFLNVRACVCVCVRV
jgi:hypothetical protein